MFTHVVKKGNVSGTKGEILINNNWMEKLKFLLKITTCCILLYFDQIVIVVFVLIH